MQTASAGPAYAGRVVTTWQEFAALPDDGYRYQVDDGRLVVTPAPLGPHQVVITNLVAVLKAACPAGFTAVPSPIDWVLSGQHPVRVRQPDIAVVGKAVALNPPIRTAPLLVVEIAGPDSTRVDEGEKVDLYGQAGLRHYWVLRWHDRLLSVYTHEGTGLHLAERMSADRAVALLDPFPVVFRIEDLLLP